MLPQHDLDERRTLGRDVEWDELRKWLQPRDVAAQADHARRRAAANPTENLH